MKDQQPPILKVVTANHPSTDDLEREWLEALYELCAEHGAALTGSDSPWLPAIRQIQRDAADSLGVPSLSLRSSG